MKKIFISLSIFILFFVALMVKNNVANSSKSVDNIYGKDELHPATIEHLDDEN